MRPKYGTTFTEKLSHAYYDTRHSRLVIWPPRFWLALHNFKIQRNHLYPLLHRLRIVATSTSLHFLDLLLSSALTTLGLTAISVETYTTLLDVGISITNQLATSTYMGSPAIPSGAEKPIVDSPLLSALQTFEVDGIVTSRLV